LKKKNEIADGKQKRIAIFKQHNLTPNFTDVLIFLPRIPDRLFKPRFFPRFHMTRNNPKHPALPVTENRYSYTHTKKVSISQLKLKWHFAGV